MSMLPPSSRGPGPSGGPPGGRPLEDLPTLMRYRVVLHRVAGQGLLYVADTLRQITRYGEAEAMSRMWQAHHSGRAIVLLTHLERAELYVEQFGERGLSASIEPA